jgi:hypothetical protein
MRGGSASVLRLGSHLPDLELPEQDVSLELQTAVSVPAGSHSWIPRRCSLLGGRRSLGDRQIFERRENMELSWEVSSLAEVGPGLSQPGLAVGRAGGC